MKRMSCYLVPLVLSSRSTCVSAADADPSLLSASLLSLVVPLLAVVFGLAALWWVWRRYSGKGGSSGPLRIVQVIAVGQRERVVVVDHHTQRFMLGVTQTSITLIADLSPENAANLSSNASASPNANVPSTRG
ncbi:MAG: flagellar biosynthetic protein FliO [Dokdonella sp.]